MIRLCLVNNHGFISVYAIVFLLIFMSITILIQAEITTFVDLQKNDTLTEVCILQNIRNKQLQAIQEKDANEPNHERSQNEEEQIMQIPCGNTEVTLHITPQQIKAFFLSRFGHIQMVIALSEEGYIADYAYE